MDDFQEDPFKSKDPFSNTAPDPFQNDDPFKGSEYGTSLSKGSFFSFLFSFVYSFNVSSDFFGDVLVDTFHCHNFQIL